MTQHKLGKILAWQNAIAVDGLQTSTALYRNAADRFEMVGAYPNAPENDFREEVSSEDATAFLMDRNTTLVLHELEA